ncbi:MAG: hypothetical protein E6I88_01095 [Chloroflexi bacterium]|nr:MAG: hypothetical protein E6I88_01095 [Chloroflexota bacterium]TME48331.1 MAG: hypothetical protein E6I56_01715 [Chloroflexota bacterium]
MHIAGQPLGAPFHDYALRGEVPSVTSVLPAITVVLILAALCIVIAVCFGALRRREAELRSPQRATGTGTAGSISGDEIIDVHLALKDLSSLREIAERIAA